MNDDLPNDLTIAHLWETELKIKPSVQNIQKLNVRTDVFLSYHIDLASHR
jgi:hypothetical protein